MKLYTQPWSLKIFLTSKNLTSITITAVRVMRNPNYTGQHAHFRTTAKPPTSLFWGGGRKRTQGGCAKLKTLIQAQNQPYNVAMLPTTTLY